MEDFEYLKMLREATEAGIIKASLNLKKLEHIDSPISVQADSNRWIYSLIVIVSAAAWFGGIWAAVGAIAAGAVAWFTVGRPWHRRRMERRFHESTMKDTEAWKKLWRMEGVVLTDTKTGTECASPSGNWRAFVRTSAASTAPSN